LNSETRIGLAGTRIFMPARSFGDVIGLAELVIWRKPWSYTLPTGTRLTLSKAARICAPSPPSIAFQTVG
jgi:hypothetical protein